jgi:hypothetical protein
MHKEKFFLIIIKLNQMNTYFGEYVFLYIIKICINKSVSDCDTSS